MKTTTIKTLLAFSFFTFHFSLFIFSQNVGINTTGALPNASAILDLSNSASMALLAPQVALTDVTFLAPVPGPGPAGLIVYNTNPSTNGGSGTGFYYWDGAQWNYLLTGATSGWSLTGNTGTNPAVNYLGTNDPEDLVFKTFSTERMRITSAGGVGIGTPTPQNALDVNGGEAIGTYAGVNAAPANGLIVSGQVGIGTNSPDPSAITDLTSTNNGFLVPRMSTAQMNAIANPALSLMIYDITTNCFMFYTGVQWQPMACICQGAPSAPGTISGVIGVCTGAQGIVYSIASVSGATSYNWNVPSGANIVSGQGTTSITVNFGNSNGFISVTASNSCGTSPATTQAITIYTAPAAPGSITGNTNPAVNLNYTYSVAAVSGATSYKWTLTGSGASISSGQGTNSISITYGATPGSYTLCVYDSNACGVSAPGPCLSITSNNCLHGSQSFSYSGTATRWAIPLCVSTITIVANGGEGGTNACLGGAGASIQGTFTVTGGHVLTVVVGNAGSLVSNAGSGGGGSGVIDSNASALLIDAGGGGGAAENCFVGGPGLTTTAGGNASGLGGLNGLGGEKGYFQGDCGWSGGGGGYSGDGYGSGTQVNGDGGALPGDSASDKGWGGGYSWAHGGGGGSITGCNYAGPQVGAFGCGGGGSGVYGGGGGGGYSGGGGGQYRNGADYESAGGGGGSYNGGTNQVNVQGANSGAGTIAIYW